MDKKVYKVNPIIIYPECMLENGTQGDCFTCEKIGECKSPRSMCIRPYKNHKMGCPNFGKRPTCPPNIPCMYDQIFDISDVYAVVTEFYLQDYFRRRAAENPNLTEGQVKNSRYWQPKTIRDNDYGIRDFYLENPKKQDYISTRLLECMGVDVVNTMKDVGLEIKFSPGEIVYRIAYLAKVYEEALERYGFRIYEETNKQKKGVKTLVKK